MNKFFAYIGENFTSILSNSLLLTGVSSLFYGAYQLHPPSAFIILGILLMGIALLPLLFKGGK